MAAGQTADKRLTYLRFPGLQFAAKKRTGPGFLDRSISAGAVGIFGAAAPGEAHGTTALRPFPAVNPDNSPVKAKRVARFQ